MLLLLLLVVPHSPNQRLPTTNIPSSRTIFNRSILTALKYSMLIVASFLSSSLFCTSRFVSSLSFVSPTRRIGGGSSFASIKSNAMRSSSLFLSNCCCSISDAFDGGNIEYLRTDGNTVYLNVKSDPVGELEKANHRQYFSFRSIFSPTALGIPTSSSSDVNFVIENAKNCSFPRAWPGTTVFFSSNFITWERVLSTSYQDGQLTWSFDYSTSPSNVVYFCYFPPYSYERHLNLISTCASKTNPSATVRTLGKSLDGREIDCVTVGNGPTVGWIIHRQHPGETMAEYFAEGLILRLLDDSNEKAQDEIVKKALDMFTFHIIPNMCPDGSVRGYLRTNSCGANLNREWCSNGDYTAPTLERSPEVFHVLNEMNKTGVDIFVDVHGDEELPFNFIVGNQGLSSWDDRMEALHGAFLGAYCRANSDMQKRISYPTPPKASGRANLSLASKQVGHRFNCLAVTLEMPFKDCLTNPDPIRGWSPDRSMKLGASLLDALVYVQPYLRADGVGLETFPSEDDAYVHPTSYYSTL